MRGKTKRRPERIGDGTQVSQGFCKGKHNPGYSKRDIHFTDTQSQAFAAIQKLHETEMRKARKFFIEHPDGSYSRADLVEALELPINHITRIVYDLLDVGFISVTGKDRNPRSGVTVEMLKLSGKEAGDE